jgi:zinc protease
LDNGLIVLLKEAHNAPLVSHWLLYRVGSRNEPTGLTGASHWVEHMLFKGTDRYPMGFLDHAIDRVGGSWNAQTSIDYTAYYETLPSNALKLALEAEADRMMNARFDPEEVESERTVILSEREGHENYPSFWLGEAISAAAFHVHGYHHEIIGDTHDLHTMTRADLYTHYRRYYAPNNAILSIVGDFHTDDLLTQIEALYAAYPKNPDLTHFVRPEPPQQGERRVRIERNGGAHYLSVNYRIPCVTDPDWMILYMLDAIFGGPTGFGGGSIGTKTTRLYKALIRSELAVSASAGMQPTLDPYLYSVDVTLREGRTLEQVEAVVFEEIEKLRRGEISPSELEKARKQARALFAYRGETVTSQAFWMAYFEHIAGSYQWLTDFEDRLSRVTVEDVQRVAQTYLGSTGRTVGWFIPK